MLTYLLAGAALLLLGGMLTTNLLNYIASAALTITLNSLASSASLLTGRQSAVVDNTANKYLDYHVSAKFKVGTPTGTTGYIYVYAVAMLDDTTWPDTFGAADAGVTVTSAGVAGGCLALLAAVAVDATTPGRVYPMKKTSVASRFGGVCPPKFVIWVTQNTGDALDATAGGTVTAAGIDTTNG